MKKVTIIGLIVLGVGFSIFFGGFALSGFDIFALSTKGEYVEKTFTDTKTFSDIIIEDSNLNINIGTSDDDMVHVTYYENDKETYTIENNGKLNIKKNVSSNWLDHIFVFDFAPLDVDLTVLVPKDYNKSLNIKTRNSRIEVNNMALENCDLHTSNGKVYLNDVVVSEDLTVKSSNAGVELTEFTGKNVDLTTSNGSIIFTDAIIENYAIVKTSNSSINLNNVFMENGNFEGDTSNGRIECKDFTGKMLDLKTSNASVTTEVIDVNELLLDSSNGRISFSETSVMEKADFKTSNASIEGYLQGELSDFTIYSKTSNSSNNLPEEMQGGSKKLNVKTSNGRIDINFLK